MFFNIDNMIVKDPTSEWFMAGTEGTGEFVVPFKSDLGRVGFRCTSDLVRVRIEPTLATAAREVLDNTFAHSDGWKQPSEWQYRYSKTFTDVDDAIAVVEFAIEALGEDGKKRQGGYVRFWRMAIRQYLPVASAA